MILDDERPIPELADSKRLTPKQRSRVARAVRTEARAFAVALAEPAEIDSINVLEASLLAMSRAIAKLSVVPGLVRVDGTHTPRYSGDRRPFEIEAVVRGDQSVPAISADGRWVVFITYLEDQGAAHPFGRQVKLRLMDVRDGSVRDLTPPFFGGQGTINVPSWSPDSRRVAFVAYEQR